MQSTDTKPVWYSAEDVEKEDNTHKLISMGLKNWANCYTYNPPVDFSEVMVMLGKKLGIAPLYANFKQLADQYSPECCN